MAARVYEGLDPSSRKQLDKADPGMQGKPAGAIVAKVARPSVREMMAKAKAKPVVAATEPPTRPPTAKERTPLRPPVDRAATSPASPLHRLVPSLRHPRTPSTTTPAPTHDVQLQHDLDALASPPAPTDDLLQLASPFIIADDQDPSSSFDPTPRSTPLSSPAPHRNASLVLPITEKVVDAALRDQAAQAEQAAQRLLELAESDDEGREEGRGEWSGERTGSPGPNFQRTPVTRRVLMQDVFEDSPDVKDSRFEGAGKGKGSKNWWMKRTDRESFSNSGWEGELKTTTQTFLSHLHFLQIPPNGRRRSQPSSRRSSRDRSTRQVCESSRRYQRNVRCRRTKRRARLSCRARRSRARRRVVRWRFGTRVASWRSSSMGSRACCGILRCVCVLVPFRVVLTPLQAEDRKDLALVLFKDVVQNQFPSFSGDEIRIFNLLFFLREDPSRSVSRPAHVVPVLHPDLLPSQVIAAVEGIADVLVDQLEPLYGLGTLRSTLEAYLQQPQTDAVSRSYALGLRLFGKLFERLPSEVLEEELPKARTLIKKVRSAGAIGGGVEADLITEQGLNDAKSGDLRRAAVTVLVAAQSVLQDEQRLYLMMDGLGKDQVSYSLRLKKRS